MSKTDDHYSHLANSHMTSLVCVVAQHSATPTATTLA